MIDPFFKSDDNKFYLLHGDSLDLLNKFEHKFDMVFADPPYFLSNNGLTIKNGKIVSVNKGSWDHSEGIQFINEFNRKWLKLVRDKMNEDATIWISGTMHNIFSIGQILSELGFKILNIITWEKTNPPPNFSCRFFTFSTEQIIWARKCDKTPHYYNYNLMRQLNNNKQMKDVWKLPAIANWEKKFGKHPTQKPLSVLTRIILASTKPNSWILDPFSGASTTGIAANLLNRRFLGIDQEQEFLNLSIKRKLELQIPDTALIFKNKLASLIDKTQFTLMNNVESVEKDSNVILLFCDNNEHIKSVSQKKIYLNAYDSNDFIKDFQTSIQDATKVILYSKINNKYIYLNGNSSDIKSIKLKHKTEIKVKNKDLCEYYFEIILKTCFLESDELKVSLKRKSIIGYLPSKSLYILTSWQKIMSSVENTIPNLD